MKSNSLGLETTPECSSVSVIRLSVVGPIGIVLSRILYMALDRRLFSLVRPSQFYVLFESLLDV